MGFLCAKEFSRINAFDYYFAEVSLCQQNILLGCDMAHSPPSFIIFFCLGMPCYRAKRKGERKRKAVRGCIVGADIAVLSLVIVKRGVADLPGLTDVEVPRRLGPKRVDKIRKMFNLTKEDDPRDYIVRRKVKTKSGKVIIKKPKIQVFFVLFTRKIK